MSCCVCETVAARAYNSMAVVSLYFHDYARAQQELENALDAQFYTEKYSPTSSWRVPWAVEISTPASRASRSAIVLAPGRSL